MINFAHSKCKRYEDRKFKVLLYIQKAFDVLVEKRMDFEAKEVKEALQGSVKTQVTLLSFVDEHIGELSTPPCRL